MLTRQILKAAVVYNGMGTARADGAVVIQSTGDTAQIIGVDSLETARRNYPEAEVADAGFALSPAPVNAHTHLDLTRMPFTPGLYEDFIRAVIAHGTQRREGGLEAAQTGVAALKAYGVRVIGDIVTSEAVMHYLLSEPELQGVAYWEVFAPDPADAEVVFNQTVAWLRTFRKLERPGGVRVGLSPHTPHTVSAPLLQKLAALAQVNKLPMQIHVAEAPGELALHRDGTGSLMDFMRPLLGHWQPSGLSPVMYLRTLGVLEAHPTLIHAVHVNEEDVQALAAAGCTVVHCPRSNEALGCGRFPWELYMKHGVEVGFGTDSLGSSPSLSVVSEVYAARELHGERASDLALVRAAVKGGYRVLGLQPPRFSRGDATESLFVWPVE